MTLEERKQKLAECYGKKYKIKATGQICILIGIDKKGHPILENKEAKRPSVYTPLWEYIEEVNEPKEIYVNLYSNGLSSNFFTSEKEAKVFADDDSLVKTIKFIEVIE